MLPVCIPACLSLISYTKLFTCDMGQLIPVMVDEVVPGDIFKIGNQSVIRMQPWLRRCSMRLMPMCIIFLYLIVCFGTNGRIFITGGIDGEDTPRCRFGNRP